MCPAAYDTINTPSVGAGVPDGPFFRTSCNPALRKRFHISVGTDAPVRLPTIAPLASPVITRAHRARGNPFPFGFVQGYYGCPCCGAQNFCAALRRTLEILTAATRSLRCFCHRQRSVRSPHRPAYRTPCNPFVGATLAVARPDSYRISYNVSLRSQCAHWPWQSVLQEHFRQGGQTL